MVYGCIICNKPSKIDRQLFQFVFEPQFMTDPHRSIRVVEALCFISKHKSCLDQNTSSVV